MDAHDARRQIAAFELAASRAAQRGNPQRAEQCETSARELRKAHGIPEPVSFGRDNPLMAETQRAMFAFIRSHSKDNQK